MRLSKHLIVSAVLAASPLFGAQKPRQPSGKLFWALTITAGIAEALDAGTTIHTLRSLGGREYNPLFGSQPSTARIIGMDAAMSVGWYLLGRHEIKRGHPRLAQIMMAGSVCLESTMAVHNFAAMPARAPGFSLSQFENSGSRPILGVKP